MIFTIIGVVVCVMAGIALGTWVVLKTADKTEMDVSDAVFSFIFVLVVIIAVIWTLLG